MASLSSPSKGEEADPPEFVIQRNLILQKRSSSVVGDSVRDNEKGRENSKGAKRDASGATAAVTGPPTPFKGVHPYDEKSSHHSSLQVGENRPLSGVATANKNADTLVLSELISESSRSRALTKNALTGVGVDVDVGRKATSTNMGEDYEEECSVPPAPGVFGIKSNFKTTSSDSGSDVSSVVNGDIDRIIKYGDRKKMTNGTFIASNSNNPRETEFSYGPGFVDKLKSRFISLSSSNKVKVGGNALRRFSSLENVLDDDSDYPRTIHHPRNSSNCSDVVAKRKRPIGTTTPANIASATANNSPQAGWNRFNRNAASGHNKIGGFKRAKSMETLLLESERRKNGPARILPPNHHRKNQRPLSMIDTPAALTTALGLINENLVIIESPVNNNGRIGPNNNNNREKEKNGAPALNRQVSAISDEELPKPDIVKNCKLIFETAGKNAPPNTLANVNNVVNDTRSTTVPRCSAKNANNKNCAATLPKSFVRSAKDTSSSSNVVDDEISQSKSNDSRVNRPNNNGSVEEESKEMVGARNQVSYNSNCSITNGEVKSPSSVKDVKEVKEGGVPSRQTFEALRQDEHAADLRTLSPVEKPPSPSSNNDSMVSNGGVVRLLSRLPRPPTTLNTRGKTSDSETSDKKDIASSDLSLSSSQSLSQTSNEVSGGENWPSGSHAEETPLSPLANSRGPIKRSLVNGNKGSDGPDTSRPDSAAPSSLNGERQREAPPRLIINNDLKERDVSKASVMLNEKPASWQKAPPTSTTVVYDFRGKDVKSHLPSNPAPFGCAPARINKKKKAQQKRQVEGLTLRNGGVHLAQFGGGETNDYSDDDFDETDVGAHLPQQSGIHFVGENARCARTSILTTRNKKLKIQFDDSATSTFEYPSEDWIYEETASGGLATANLLETVLSPDNQRPRPTTDEGSDPSPAVEATPLRTNNTILNSTGGLSNYTPSVLSSGESSFQLGVSRITKEDSGVNAETTDRENREEEPPEQTSSWSSSTSTSDLLF